MFAATGLSFNQAKLESLKESMVAGHVRSVADRAYALADIADAHRYVESGRKTGAVVIEIVPAIAGNANATNQQRVRVTAEALPV